MHGFRPTSLSNMALASAANKPFERYKRFAKSWRHDAERVLEAFKALLPATKCLPYDEDLRDIEVRGTPWKTFRDAWELPRIPPELSGNPGMPCTSFWESRNAWETALGDSFGRALENLWKNLLNRPPRIHVRRESP